jgi:hypothetical protein
MEVRKGETMAVTTNAEQLRDQRDTANLALARASRMKSLSDDERETIRRDFAYARTALAIVESLEGYPPLSYEQRMDLQRLVGVL